MQPQVLTNAVIITSRASKLDFPSRDDTQPPGCILCRDSPMALHTLLHLWVRKNCSMPLIPRLVLVKRDRSLGQWIAGSMSTNAFWAGL